MSPGVGKFAQAVHAEHGVELLQEDQPRVEAAGEQAAAPLLVRAVFFPPFIHFPSPSSRPVEQMEQKMTASDIFKDKKDNYPQSVPKLFVGTRLSKSRHSLLCSTVATATKRSHTFFFLLLRRRGHQPQGAADSGQREDEGKLFADRGWRHRVSAHGALTATLPPRSTPCPSPSTTGRATSLGRDSCCC